MNKLETMQGTFRETKVERITIVKIRGDERISKKNSSVKVKTRANLTKETNGII